MNEYSANRGDGSYAFLYASFNIDGENGNAVTTSISTGGYVIGTVSNLTGALVGKEVYLGGKWGNALYIGTGYNPGQIGTFDLELTDSNGKKIIVTYTVIITE